MKLYNYLLSLCVLTIISLDAQRLPNLFTPKTREELFRILDNYELVAVNFVDYDRSKDKPRDVEEMQGVFFDVADEEVFINTVAFVGINLKEMPSLYENIKPLKDVMQGQSTIVMLFHHGKPLKKVRSEEVKSPDMKTEDKEKQAVPAPVAQPEVKKMTAPVYKKGFIRKRDLEDFINKYFGDFIVHILEELEEAEQRQMLEQQEQIRYVQPEVRYVQQPVYYPSYQPYYRSYEYPYGGYSRPYRRWGGWGWGPGFGIGFGFGRRWGGIGFGIGF